MPVYKVNNNATQQKPFKPPWVKDDAPPSTPSAPPWRRQQELKNPQVVPKSPSSPGPKNDPPVFPKPAEQQKADVPPPAPGRKQSKITIIPSKPMSNGSSSILAPPPSLPAPPCNPNLAMAPPKPAIESKIQVSSKIAEPKKTRNVPIKQDSVEKVVPIKIENTANKPASPPPVKKTTATPKVTQNKTLTRQATSKEKSPSPPPAKVQQNNVRVPPKLPPKLRTPSPPPPAPKLKEVPKTQPPKQRTPSPPPAPKLKSALKKTPPQKIRSPSPPPKQNNLKPRDTSPPKQQQTKKQPPAKQASPPPAPKPKKSPSSASVPPPPPPPMAPPPPPPPPGFNENRTPLTEQKRQRIEALKSRPRRRPDWAYMMKELESGVKLNHVQCNDRSKPLLPKAKEAKTGQFIYESERERGGNLHHQLLNQIQRGANLKHVKCNDRSRPHIQGLRKFRRQLTIEEQIKAPETQLSEDELDDIDKVRDDLQATKQTLEFELKEKENLQKENRRLGVRILNLEEELDKLKKIVEASGNENALVNALKAEVEAAKSEIIKQELINQEKTKQMAAVQAQLEDSQHRNLVLEKRIEHNTGSGVPPETSSSSTQTTDLQKTPSRRDASIPETLLPEPGSDEEEDEADGTSEEEESESEDDQEEATKAAQEKRLQRELKMLSTKLKTFKEKEITAKNERRALKYQLTNLTKALKVEQKKFKCLQREVNSMANVMKEAEGSSDEDDDDEESEESEESETESESDVESEPDDTSDPPQFRIEAFNKKNKTHENVLSALKKGNYLLKANIDKLKDDLEKQREKSLSLQEDLNAVLAEIG